MKALLYFAVTQTTVSGKALPQPDTSTAQITNILGIVFTFIGAIALLMIVISGLRYILSSGDPERANKAKNGIIYSLVGLVLAITAQAIVVFIVKRI